MCGITGIVDYRDNLKASSRRTLQVMSDSLHHRGPDAEGTFFDTHAAFGHKRLSIIDLSGGVQPMHSRDENYVLTYNGEVYNFQEIRDELEKKGRAFKTKSDTEVILQSYEEWGPDCLERFNGDFAFAIWNKQKQELFLARDRMGVKPLYFTDAGGTLIFASEVKAILKHPKVDPALDEYALIECLTSFQPLYPRTLIKDVQMLDAGHYLIFNRMGITKKQYWDIQYREHTESFEETKEHVSSLLEDATRLRMVSDVPICGLLSGGLDSSALCAFMDKHSDDPVRTFSVNFEGNKDTNHKSITQIFGDDTYYAQLVRDHIGSEHEESIIGVSDYFNLLPKTARARDLPTSTGSEVGIYRLCEMVKKKATVALSGEGADEVCAGYFMFFSEEAMSGKLNPLLVNRMDKMSFIFHPKFKNILKPLKYLNELKMDYIENMPKLWEKEEDRMFNTLQYIQVKRILPYLLDRADKISMAASVELRVPFCDHRFVEYFFNIPSKLKMQQNTEKYMLRESLRKHLPQEIVDRKKSIFPFPMDQDELDKLYENTRQVLHFQRRHHSHMHKLLNFNMIHLLISLSRKQKVPVIGSHIFFTTVLTLDYLCREYDLSFPEYLA